MLLLLVFVSLYFVLLNASTDSKVEHVIVLMMENRAFDHMLGSLNLVDTRIDGCVPGKPGCSNPKDPSDPNSELVEVNWNAEYTQSDPPHQIHQVSEQIYGRPLPDGIPLANDSRKMNGFVKAYSDKTNDDNYGPRIMEQFSASAIPALTTLAQEFGVFDGWHASVPGPTMPNRAYTASATSAGMGTNNKTELAIGLKQTTMFKQLLEMGLDYKVYFQDAPSTAVFKDIRRERPAQRVRQLRHFYQDVADGNLPEFTFLEPSYFDVKGQAATDQHGGHDVSEGDKLIAQVYNAVRQSPLWNKVALLVTYDEHGGFFDHRVPPSGPSPDGISSTDDPFDFTRLGVRVPAVIISPLVPKGAVFPAAPPNQGQYEHSSIAATVVHKLFSPKKGYKQPVYLTKRDAWAATFEGVFSLSEPRTDCLSEAPTLAKSLREQHPGSLPPLDGQQPLTDLQRELLAICAGAAGDEAVQGRIVQGETLEAVFHGWTEEQGSQYCQARLAASLLKETLDVKAH
jgi:phospholipase C